MSQPCRKTAARPPGYERPPQAERPLPNVYLHLDERSVVHTTYPLAACFPLQMALIRAGTCLLATYTSSGLQFTVAALAINEFSKIVATDGLRRLA
jgi:hypothetical protein